MAGLPKINLMKYSKFLTLITPLLVLVLFEIYFFFPGYFCWMLVLAVLSIIATVAIFTKRSSAYKNWWDFSILPGCFTVSLAVYSIIIPDKFFVQFLFFLNAGFVYWYLKNIYYFLIKSELYKSFFLENASSYGNFLTVFFLASAVYGLQAFLSLPIWPLMFIFLIMGGLIIYNVIWANKVDAKNGVIYILVGCLVLTELAWSISFLPLNYNISGLILAINYYILIGLIRFWLKENFDSKTVRPYLIFGFLAVFVLLLTSRWM